MITILDKVKTELNELGFSIVDNVYSETEIQSIANFINGLDTSNPIFRKTDDLFAIRQFVKEFPEIKSLLFNNNLKKIIEEVGGDNCFVVKSIYFDKPEKSNWFVAYHQDLTISVDKKTETEGFGPWTVKQNQFAVQPTLAILENIFTIRIHLDDTDENNGALKVIDKSHAKSIYRPETINWNLEKETICSVNSGGIMLMKPLLLHGSNRTQNNKKRRVIHIEFSNMALPENLNWSEYSTLN
ncbi:phytanoyl-CoA dioxygenase family protein [Flavobacterium terrisoli]|uniref:phytanoyl-CoA dioxygenase family protein n=1 Tax=Flavobacterium terrisoli TaxID=3242195 RepID=UPI0025436783|nr:phytanoyl-CoA dioxygenase family protein [Flavobacterium buctense]